MHIKAVKQYGHLEAQDNAVNKEISFQVFTFKLMIYIFAVTFAQLLLLLKHIYLS
jgi:hypothetical protein